MTTISKNGNGNLKKGKPKGFPKMESDIEEYYVEEKLSLFSILWQKFLFWLDVNFMVDILWALGKTFLLFICGVILYDPEYAKEVAEQILAWRNGFVFDMLWATLIILNLRNIWRLLKMISRSFWRMCTVPADQYIKEPTVVKDDDIIDHIIKHQSFKQIEVKEKFGWSQRKFDRVAKQLEKAGVLVRGDNNTRIFNSEKTIEDLANALNGTTPLFFNNSSISA